MEVVDAPIRGLVASNSSPQPVNYPVTLSTFVTSGDNISYVWDFGDGSGGSGSPISHQYSEMGVYTAVVTASNSINMLTATTVVSLTEIITTDVVVTAFGRDWTGSGSLLYPLALAVVGVGILAVVVFGRRRE